MFTIEIGKQITILRCGESSFWAKTEWSSYFAFTFNKYEWNSFDQIAGMEGIEKQSDSALILHAQVKGQAFEGKTFIVGIYRDSSEYHSEFFVPEDFRRYVA